MLIELLWKEDCYAQSGNVLCQDLQIPDGDLLPQRGSTEAETQQKHGSACSLSSQDDLCFFFFFNVFIYLSVLGPSCIMWNLPHIMWDLSLWYILSGGGLQA